MSLHNVISYTLVHHSRLMGSIDLGGTGRSKSETSRNAPNSLTQSMCSPGRCSEREENRQGILRTVVTCPGGKGDVAQTPLRLGARPIAPGLTSSAPAASASAGTAPERGLLRRRRNARAWHDSASCASSGDTEQREALLQSPAVFRGNEAARGQLQPGAHSRPKST